MRLKQLKLSGFKSFANPTTFAFPKTITAIVGPNGCGKSNVIDAIRWVLGESSAKQLRGGAMSDVIFAGTQDKSAKSLASVELVFEHTQGEDGKSQIHHALNLYHELSVRRQISKDGKSDYFINGTKVRRRDVVDIFLGTGLGARSYAVIEQGMIGRIIEANPLQLREFIEEASGVSRYQSRRDDTQKQLDTASDNLSRLNDMVSELSAQQKRLEKQAKTAQLAQTFQQQIDTMSEQLRIDDYGQAWQKRDSLTKDHQAIQEKINHQQAVMDDCYEKNQQIQRHISKYQLAYQAQQNTAQRHWQQHHEAQSLLAQSQQSLANDQQRLNALNFELNRFADYQKDLLNQKQQAQAGIAELPQQLEQISRQLSQLRDEQHAQKRQRENVAKTLVELNKQKTDIEKQLAVSENAIKHHTSQQQRFIKQQQEHEQALTAWQTAKAKFDSDFADIEIIDFDEKISKISDNIERLEARIIARQEELADQADEVESLTRQHRQAEQQRHTWLTEQATLQNLLEQLHEQEKQVQHNAKQQNQSENIPTLPTLAENLILTEKGKTHVAILDNVLGLMANWAILDGDFHQEPTQEQAILNQLNQAFTLLSQKQNVNKSTLKNCLQFSKLIQSPNVALFERMWLYEKAVTQAEFKPIFADIKNALAENWLFIQVEETLYLLNDNVFINIPALIANLNTKNGKSYATPTLGLSQKIQQQNRIDELEDLLTQQKPQLDRLANALQEATVSLQEWQAQDRNVRNELLTLTQQKQTLQHNKVQQQHRYQSALDKITQDKARLEQDSKRLHEEMSGFNDNLANEQNKFVELKQALAELQPQLQQKISARQSLDDALNNAAIAQRELEQQQNRHTQNLATGQLQITASEQQLAKAEQDNARLQTEQNELTQKIQVQTDRLPQLEQQVTEQAKQLEQANAALQQFADKLTTLKADHQLAQVAWQEAQNQFANLQQQAHAIDTAIALAEQNLYLIGEQITAKEVAGKQMTLPKADEIVLLNKTERKNLQHQINTVKHELSELGAVNYSAVAELDDVNARLAPLSEHITDLTASIDKLQQAIKQIDSQTKQLFMDMLAQVNLEMNKLFSQVFGGGQAQLILADDGSRGGKNWQAGLELMAQPKGKKNSRLALLSGGEKTLTALSLVFAIFKQQPAPFCVLDEVDAPLDDANVERFTRLIQELAKDVQFIFISHNKLSMQIADELKGVTMPQAGISKLVSVDMANVVNYLESA